VTEKWQDGGKGLHIAFLGAEWQWRGDNVKECHVLELRIMDNQYLHSKRDRDDIEEEQGMLV